MDSEFLRLRHEVDAAYAPLTNALAAMLELGQSEESKWTRPEFEARVQKLLADFSELYRNTFGHEEII